MHSAISQTLGKWQPMLPPSIKLELGILRLVDTFFALRPDYPCRITDATPLREFPASPQWSSVHSISLRQNHPVPESILGERYRKIIIRKNPLKADGSDISLLEYQLRVWLHMEGGDVQDAGAAWTNTHGTFFRLGPTAELKIQMPALPGGRALSLTTLYSYLAAVSGPHDHPWYFKSTLAYDLFRNTELNHKVALTASYERGGLNFTKQVVDTFTIGLGVLY